MRNKIYLGGWEVNPEDHLELKNFIVQHRVNQKGFEIFTQIQSGLEIEVADGMIKKVIEQPDNSVIAENPEVELPDSDEHELFWLKLTKFGTHKVGGKIPNNINTHCQEGFNPAYIGSIDGTDDNFSWLKISRLHVFYPLDFYYEPAFFDYSDEFVIKVLADKPLSKYSAKEYFSELQYETTNQVSIKELEDESHPMHQCGVPLWYQYPEYPKCPKTGELMKFVCSIGSTRETRLTKPGFFGAKKTDQYLSFGDFGHLFVFFNPNSKIAYYTIQ